MAVIKSVGSTIGDFRVGVSRGVGGNDVAVVEAGVGREGKGVGGAIGRVKESLLVLRDVVDADREDRVSIESSIWGCANEASSSGIRLGSVSSRPC